MTDTTLIALLDASHEIGGIYDMAGWATRNIAKAIDDAGKQVRELTVGELLGVIAQERDRVAQTDAATP